MRHLPLTFHHFSDRLLDRPSSSHPTPPRPLAASPFSVSFQRREQPVSPVSCSRLHHRPAPLVPATPTPQSGAATHPAATGTPTPTPQRNSRLDRRSCPRSGTIRRQLQLVNTEVEPTHTASQNAPPRAARFSGFIPDSPGRANPPRNEEIKQDDPGKVRGCPEFLERMVTVDRQLVRRRR